MKQKNEEQYGVLEELENFGKAKNLIPCSKNQIASIVKEGKSVYGEENYRYSVVKCHYDEESESWKYREIISVKEYQCQNLSLK